MKIVIKPELKISQLQKPMFGCINAKKKKINKKKKNNNNNNNNNTYNTLQPILTKIHFEKAYQFFVLNNHLKSSTQKPHLTIKQRPCYLIYYNAIHT